MKKKNRYTPTAGDTAVGVIVDRRGDGYSVDIREGTSGGGSGGGGGGGGNDASASLPALAFEGATRRSRPTLRPGDAVYCRVSSAQKHVEAELTCVDEAGRSGGLGPLGAGVVVEVSTAHARALLAATAAAAVTSSKKSSPGSSSASSSSSSSSSVSPIVAALAATGLTFEVAVGSNGRVWVGGPDAAAVSAAARALEASDGVFDAKEAQAIAKAAVEAVRAAGGAS